MTDPDRLDPTVPTGVAPVRAPAGRVSASVPTAALRVRAGACTDVGAVRSENQDSYGALPPGVVPPGVASMGGAADARPPGAVGQPALFIVADGMGGHEAGGEASEVAVRAFLAHVGASARATGDAGGADAPERISDAVQAANAAVWKRANAGGHLRRMGTTCSVLLVAGGRAVVGHVGDSRIYRIRDSVIEQITTDHTIAEAARDRPDLAEAARLRSHHLTRALGVQAEVKVDAFDAGPALPDDRYVLCSDGLEPVALDEVRRTVLAYNAQEAADWLVAQASALGSRDNATAVVVHVLPAQS